MVPFFDNPKHDFLADVVRTLKPRGVLYLEESDVRPIVICARPPLRLLNSTSCATMCFPIPGVKLDLPVSHQIESLPRPRSRAVCLPRQSGRPTSLARLDPPHRRQDP